MTLQVNEIEYCKLQIHYVADPAKVKAKRSEAIKELKKHAKIAGFREGKAPDYVIATQKKPQIEHWVKQELMAEAYQDILFETKIKPLGHPRVENADLNGSEFWCNLSMFKKPEFTLQNYKGFEVPEPHQPHTPEEMAAKMMQELRVRHGDVAPYEESDFVEMGDKVTMDLEIRQAESLREDLSQMGITYTMGQNLYPELDQNLLGMVAGEERTLDGFKIPEQEGEFSILVRIHMGLKPQPAPLDDELAFKVGFENYAQMQSYIEGVTSQQFQQNRSNVINQQVMKHLAAEHSFEVPEWYVTTEAEQLAAKGKLTWIEMSDEEKAPILTQAKENVKLALILDSIREEEPESMLSDQEIFNLVAQRLEGTGQNAKQFFVEAEQSGRLSNMLSHFRNEGVLQWVVSTCKFVT